MGRGERGASSVGHRLRSVAPEGEKDDASAVQESLCNQGHVLSLAVDLPVEREEEAPEPDEPEEIVVQLRAGDESETRVNAVRLAWSASEHSRRRSAHLVREGHEEGGRRDHKEDERRRRERKLVAKVHREAEVEHDEGAWSCADDERTQRESERRAPPIVATRGNEDNAHVTT